MPITMPPLPAPFAARGWWLVNALRDRFNLTQNQAAGIVGNIGFESGGLKILQEIAPVGGGRGGYGIAQWTGPRRLAFEKWCRNQSLAVSSDEANYGFLCVELQTTHSYTVAALKKETDLDRCVFVFGRLFEAPGGTTETHLPGFDGRLNYARQALAAGKPPPIVIGAPTAGVSARSHVERVKAIQTVLAEGGEYKGRIDGDFGPESKAAMTAFLTEGTPNA